MAELTLEEKKARAKKYREAAIAAEEKWTEEFHEMIVKKRQEDLAKVDKKEKEIDKIGKFLDTLESIDDDMKKPVR